MMDTWISLVEQTGDRFVLSRSLLDLSSIFWGNWEVQKFVCHVISHFDDPLEHILDDPQSMVDGTVDVRDDFTEIFAERYAKEFMSLPSRWYRELFRAKLLTIRIPAQLVMEYHVGYLCKAEDITAACRAIQDAGHSMLESAPDRLSLTRLRSLREIPEHEAWRIFLSEFEPLIEQDVIPQAKFWEKYWEYRGDTGF